MTLVEVTSYILYSSMITALLYAVINWNHIKNKPELWILIFLLVTTVLDLSGVYFRLYHGSKLQVFSNLIILISNLILSYWFYKHIKNKVLLFISISTILLSFFMSAFQQNFLREIFYYANFIISIILLINVFFYLYKLLLSDNVVRYNKTPAFWISIGIVIYQINLVIVFFLIQEKLKLTTNIYFTIITTVSVLLYSSIIYGIKLSKDYG
ncbi:hypothetical protein [Nonlabens ulvanivorans]|uniref:hypothetical protein n=1 Tax=Nonlabens ulvanivorans TaxID=906888 RepID=UPI0037C718D7